MRKIILAFFGLMPCVLFAQIDPAMIQQGIGKIMQVNQQVKDLKSQTSSCKFSSGDGSFTFDLMVEYNSEQLANDTDVWKTGGVTFTTDGTKDSPDECSNCIYKAGGKTIKESRDIDSRQIASAVFRAMSDWKTPDYTADELTRINKITNASACAGQAVKVLGGMKEQVLSPLLGNIMPGAEGMMGGLGGMGGIGNIGGMLGSLGGMAK